MYGFMLLLNKIQIPFYPFKLSSFKRRILKNAPEGFFSQLFPIISRKIQYLRYRRKACFFSGFRETVPGTNILANITTKHPVIKLPLHSIWYQGIFKLYSKIRNAFAAVNHFVRKNGFSGAFINASCTGSAEIFCYHIIVMQFQVNAER